jgi:hypothetical protein
VPLKIASVVPVWILVAVATVIVAVVSAGYEFFTWLPIVLAGAIVLTFCVQLTLRRKEGFNGRLNLSVGGSFLIVVVAALVLWSQR